MDAPTLPVTAEKNLEDPIKIIVDVVHLAPADVFPAATVEMNALRFRMGMAEDENASLRGWIKTIEAIDTITRRQEKRARLKALLAYLNGLKRCNQISILVVVLLRTRPKTLDDAIELANDLMDQKLRTYVERQAENKRKLDNNNQAQQQLLKR
uniref:Reverse transcriptase domain-containing protein n=1 Tax=Tanacetum cinerariifolium TaxID=118510 RepID=A0A699L866_TANCI|nr:hypothetical protein [Tanacetum cinerariifolium]